MLKYAIASYLLQTIVVTTIYFVPLQPYEGNLFSKVLPCLCAIANALPADYGLSPALERLQHQPSIDTEGSFVPNPVDTTG